MARFLLLELREFVLVVKTTRMMDDLLRGWMPMVPETVSDYHPRVSGILS